MLTLYHGTNAVFNAFTLDFAARPSMASNGFLGVWLAVDKAHAARFGTNCLTVLADVQNPRTIGISELMQWHKACGKLESPDPDDVVAREACRRFYTDIREQHLSQGFDAIQVQEQDGQVDIVIVLQPERLHIVQ